MKFIILLVRTDSYYHIVLICTSRNDKQKKKITKQNALKLMVFQSHTKFFFRCQMIKRYTSIKINWKFYIAFDFTIVFNRARLKMTNQWQINISIFKRISIHFFVYLTYIWYARGSQKMTIAQVNRTKMVFVLYLLFYFFRICATVYFFVHFTLPFSI